MNSETKMATIKRHETSAERRQRIIAEDSILTDEDKRAIKEADEAYERGEIISHEELKKLLGL